MDPRTCEQLDACRPGRADWEDDELAQLAEELRNNRELRDLAARLEDLDQAIASALIDVSPPPGLAQRIMARLDQAHPPVNTAGAEPAPAQTTVQNIAQNIAQTTEPAQAAAPVAASAAPLATSQAVQTTDEATDEAPAVAPPVGSRRLSRRTWIVAATSAAAVAVAAALALWPSGPPQLGPEEIIAAADRLYLQELQQHQGWLETAPQGTPEVPRDVLARAVAWRQAQVAGADAYVYDVVNARGKRAVLLAVVCQGDRLPSAPPQQPQSSSGRMIAVWHAPQQNVAYVLVVEGTLADYRSFVALGRSLT